MVPKDLLQYLEKGDKNRVIETLKKGDEGNIFADYARALAMQSSAGSVSRKQWRDL